MKITLKGILGIVTTIIEVVKEILPIARRVSPQIDQAVDQLEEVVEQGGEDAAAWINSHPEVIDALITIGDKLSDVGAAVKTTAVVARNSALDNVVTPPEAEAVMRSIYMIRNAIAESDKIDAAFATIAAAK